MISILNASKMVNSLRGCYAPPLDYFIFKIFLDNSLILSVRLRALPSILINKYIDRAIGKPTLATRVCILESIAYNYNAKSYPVVSV